LLITTGENTVKLVYFALIGTLGLGLLSPLQVISAEKTILSATSDKATPSSNEGTVVSSMNAAAYTYMELESKGRRFWIAAPTTKVNVGDHISFVQSMVMRNFNSKTLNRTFESVIFVTSIKIGK
jgi:hypothetical protein